MSFSIGKLRNFNDFGIFKKTLKLLPNLSNCINAAGLFNFVSNQIEKLKISKFDFGFLTEMSVPEKSQCLISSSFVPLLSLSIQEFQ